MIWLLGGGKMVSLRLQLTTFLTMIIIGGMIGIGFDFYRVLRSKITFNQLVTDVADILFSLVVSLIICGGLLYSNDGRVRIYFLLGVILGLIIYYFIFSGLVINFFRFLGAGIGWLQVKLCWGRKKLKQVVTTLDQGNGDDSNE